MIESQIIEVIKKSENCNYSRISRELNLSPTTVSDICRILEKEGKIEIKDLGYTKYVKIRNGGRK